MKCQKCGSEIDLSNNICWACGQKYKAAKKPEFKRNYKKVINDGINEFITKFAIAGGLLALIIGGTFLLFNFAHLFIYLWPIVFCLAVLLYLHKIANK